MIMLTVQELSEKTSDAYSFDRYNSWEACIKKLRKAGYDDREIEAILRSKWTRWAADAGNKPYGKASSVDLLNYINQHETKESVIQLTLETFETI